MLKQGEPAPDFTATQPDGRTLRLSELRDRYVVIYFFPKAFTRGCTLETKRFRDAYPEIKELGGEVIGISVDDPKVQGEFADSCEARFPMVGDADGSISRSFGVLWPVLEKSRRITFVVDKHGLIRGVFDHEIRVGKHLDDALGLIRRLVKGA